MKIKYKTKLKSLLINARDNIKRIDKWGINYDEGINDWNDLKQTFVKLQKIINHLIKK